MKEDFFNLDIIFDEFPEPVILFREGATLYCNAAAASVFEGLAAGSPCPPELLELDGEAKAQFVLTRRLGAQRWNMTATSFQNAVLAVLRPESESGAAGHVEILTGQIRRQMAALVAAVQQLEEITSAAESSVGEKWVAILNQSIYRVLRAVGNAELAQALEGDAETVYRPAPLDLAGLCEEIEPQVSSLAGLAGRKFIFESEQASLITQGDAELLQRMLLSLLSNALKMAPAGGKLGLRLKKRGDRAILTVWDNGAGMGEENLSALFQKREPANLFAPETGLGLGLEKVRKIACLHNGTVVVESSKDAGVKVTVSLPIEPADGLPLRTAQDRHANGFSPLLIELSDALPWQAFCSGGME